MERPTRRSVLPSRLAVRHLMAICIVSAVMFAFASRHPILASLMVALVPSVALTWRAAFRSDRPGTTVWFIFLGAVSGFVLGGWILIRPADSFEEMIKWGSIAMIPISIGAFIGKLVDDYARRHNIH